jgi:uncharacterized protein Yka (UPF0111/DUF47 family)
VGLGERLSGYLKEWRELFRPRDERFLELLLAEARLAAQAGEAFLRYVEDPWDGFAEDMARLEAEGDAVLEEIMRALRQSLVAPIAGSDIFYLGNALDDVLDQIEDMANEDQALAAAEPSARAYREPHFLSACQAFAQALAELPTAITFLFRAPRRAEDCILRLRSLYGEGKRAQSLAYAALVAGQAEDAAFFAHAGKVQWVRLFLRRVEKITNALAGILATS